jgi:peptidoglycan/LPS O-acetylase OafA/YrhL
LLAGSILAYFEINNGHRSQNKTLNLILPTIGLLLIGHSILFFNDKMFHPSFYTLSPIIGVCLIIWFSNKDELITKILSTKLFVGIGLISYSLYLCHYPIFAFNRITFLTRDNIFLNYY